MSEQEFSPNELEPFREQVGEGIEEILHIITSGQDTSLPVDSFTLRISDVEEISLTPPQRIVLRDSLYRLIGRSTTESTPPITTYNIQDPSGDKEVVNVFEGNFPHPTTEELTPVFLHEQVRQDGSFGWVISLSSEENPFFKEDPAFQPEEEESDLLDDPIIKEAQPTIEYSMAIIDRFKHIFPEYSGIIQDTFRKNKRICLYQEHPNEKGQRMALNLLASPTKLGYILGFVAEVKGKLTFKYKSLPRIIETQTSKGVQMDHPQTDWEFEEKDHEKRVRSFNEMEGVLMLLRQHDEF